MPQVARRTVDDLGVRNVATSAPAPFDGPTRLAAGRGPTIAALSPLAGGFYFGGVLGGIASSLIPVDGRMIAIQTLNAGHLNGDLVESLPFDSKLAWGHIQGLIVVVNAVPKDYLIAARSAGKHIVMVSHEVAEIPCASVGPDNLGMRDAVLHLLDHGHRRIAFVGCFAQSDIRERYAAFVAALAERGLTPDPALVLNALNNDEFAGRAVARQLLDAGMPSTAIVAATDLNAIGICEGLTAGGLTLPRDQAIVGFDDAVAAAHVTPQLTTVRQDFAAVGRTAGELLLAAIRGEDVPTGRRDVATSLVVRESCGCSGWRPSITVAARDDRQSPAARFAATLSTALARTTMFAGASSSPGQPALVELAVARVEQLIAAAIVGEELPAIGDVRQSLADIYHLAPTPEVAAAIVDGVRMVASAAHPGDEAASHRVDDAVVGAIWALAQAQGTAAYDKDTYLLDMLAKQYDIGMEVLRGSDSAASDLGWIGHTRAREGVLGTWVSGPGSPLRLASHYSRQGRALSIGTSYDLQDFPPAELFDETPELDELLFAVPVKNSTSDWGWLVTVGHIESIALTGRETLNQWAALLTVALDEAASAARLKALEREWHAILENTPDAIARYDAQLRYEYLNAAASTALGAAVGEIVGHTDAELGRDPGVTSVWEAGLRQVLTSGAPTQIEFSEGEDDGLRWFQARMVPQLDSDGMIVGVLASSRDLTAVKKAEIALAHQAVHDSLTGLANRVLFMDRLTHSLQRLEREPNRFAVLFIDLDSFKETNDTMGHEVGDDLLVEVAHRLRAASRRVDTVARLGGDEFVILCDKLAQEEDVRLIGDRVVRSLSQPFVSHGHQIEVSASIGIVVARDAFSDAATLLRNADAAMYQAKERGGNRFQLFDPDLDGRASARHSLEADLRHAIVRNELRLNYQPLFALEGGHINGVEALLRWQHPARGLLMPGAFISIAEQRGLIVPIGEWVLDEACRQLAAWSHDLGLTDITMAVNVSGRQLSSPGFVKTVADIVARHDIDTRRLTLEITETTLIEEGANLRETLEALVSLGLHLALDDFGTGYSALAHLRDFPVDILKIDRSFVEQLGEGGRAHQIVGALTAMAHFLNMTVVGEGIETPQQWQQLRDLQCDDGQGYLVSKAIPPDQLVALLNEINGSGLAGPTSVSA